MERLNDFDEEPIYEPYDYDLYNQTTELASGGERALAGIIDLIITSILNSLFHTSTNLGSDFNVTIGFGLFGAIYLLLRDALPFLGGQSIGKKILKIRAVDVKTGNSLTNNWKTSIIRSISLLIPIMNFFDYFMVFSASRQRFGDKWGNTIVIKEEETIDY